MFFSKRFFLLLLIQFACLKIFAVSTINYDTKQESKSEYKPWFTGPIIAGSGKTMSFGHYNIEPYFFVQESNGSYDHSWHKRHKSREVNFNPLFFGVTGLNSFMDIQATINLDSNFKNHHSDTRIGDVFLGLGFQLCQDNRYSVSPDMRLILKQDFATGHFKHLNPSKEGTDVSSSGFYRTGAALNIQKLFYFKRRLLLTRCNINYKVSTPTKISGYSVFGGNYFTQGKISPVQFFNIDLAFEYTLSQHLVFAIDYLYELQTKGKFHGKYLPSAQTKRPASHPMQRFSLAPALEYNFSAAFGIIAGCWFSLAGKNSLSFTTGVIAFNYVK